MARLKWTREALNSYKKAGDDLREAGLKPMREVQDPDCSTVLTFWAGAKQTIIMQTWTDTGDVCFYRCCNLAEVA